LAPALNNKPTAEKKEGEEKPNPFLNPNPALVVKELDQHLVLLNKFSVIPEHILLVTKGKDI
jgi:ATP adenylyltransferase